MKILANATLLLMTLAVGLSAGEQHQKMPVVSACIRPSDGQSPAQTLFRARAFASQILATAGVRLIWYARPTEQPIFIDISLDAPRNFHLGAFAYAYPFGDPRITILWNRVRISANPETNIALLAYVIAHEIAHILQGTNRHSTEGVMKANWTLQDLEQISRGSLLFKPVDVELIQLGLIARRAANGRPPKEPAQDGDDVGRAPGRSQRVSFLTSGHAFVPLALLRQARSCERSTDGSGIRLAPDEQLPQQISHFRVRLLDAGVRTEPDALFVLPAWLHEGSAYGEVRSESIRLCHLLRNGWHFRPGVENVALQR